VEPIAKPAELGPAPPVFGFSTVGGNWPAGELQRKEGRAQPAAITSDQRLTGGSDVRDYSAVLNQDKCH
jgi:hypothetical protein